MSKFQDLARFSPNHRFRDYTTTLADRTFKSQTTSPHLASTTTDPSNKQLNQTHQIQQNKFIKMAADAKTEVMQQVRQQAALQNARFLVDVSSLHPYPTYASSRSLHTNSERQFCCAAHSDQFHRKSTSTASSAPSPTPALPSRLPSRPLLQTAWRSTWRRGTRLAGSTWDICSRGVLVLGGCKFGFALERI